MSTNLLLVIILANEFLDTLTDPQRGGIDKLRSALRGCHFTDVKVRTGGKDLYFEADWLRDALDRLCDPSPNWKNSFLFVERIIDKLLQAHLINPQGNVEHLLVHYLRKSRELLYADVNGGLDEEYKDEALLVLGKDHGEL